MHGSHSAEGHFLSLRCPLDGLPVTDCRGSGYRRQRILESPALAGVGVALGGGWSVVSRTPFSDRGVLQEEHRGYLITEFVSWAGSAAGCLKHPSRGHLCERRTRACAGAGWPAHLTASKSRTHWRPS